MDWNHDGKVDNMDCVTFHEVINKESSGQVPDASNQTPNDYGGRPFDNSKHAPSPPAFEITQFGGIILGLLAFLVIAFIFMGSEFKTIWNLIEIGFVVFLVAQWLDS